MDIPGTNFKFIPYIEVEIQGGGICTPYTLCAYYSRKKMYAQRVSTIEWVHKCAVLKSYFFKYFLKETTHNHGNAVNIH